MRRYGELLTLTDEQRAELARWSQSRTLPAGDVFRARLILALAAGKSYSEIEKALSTSRPTIARWKARFEADGMAGLEPQHKGSQPRAATAAVQARVLRKTLKAPADSSTQWSCRKMAAATGISKSTVQRIWAAARLKPHRLDRYMASNDPDFESKAADIIALYMNPPQHAAVFCVDEKTAIQALDRLDPVLPLSPGRAEKHGFEWAKRLDHPCRNGRNRILESDILPIGSARLATWTVFRRDGYTAEVNCMYWNCALYLFALTEMLSLPELMVLAMLALFALSSFALLLWWLLKRRFDPTQVPEERLGGGTVSQFRAGFLAYLGMTVAFSALLLIAIRLVSHAAEGRETSIDVSITESSSSRSKTVQTKTGPKASGDKIPVSADTGTK